MRYVTLTVRPEREAFHPVTRRLVDTPRVRPKAIHNVREIDDGTIALLGDVRGDLDQYREILDTSPEVITYAVSDDTEGIGYSQIRTNPTVDALLRRRQSDDYLVKMPIECLEEGGQRMPLIGDEKTFVSAPLDPPEEIEIELESTGAYHPDLESVFAQLTTRQQEILETAIKNGYYENPRRTTHDGIADEIGITASTVGEHLRIIESKVFTSYAL